MSRALSFKRHWLPLPATWRCCCLPQCSQTCTPKRLTWSCSRCPACRRTGWRWLPNWWYRLLTGVSCRSCMALLRASLLFQTAFNRYISKIVIWVGAVVHPLYEVIQWMMNMLQPPVNDR